MSDPSDSRELTLRGYIRAVRVRVWLVVVVVALSTATAFVLANSQTRMFQASARLMYAQPTDISNPTASDSSINVDSLLLELQSVGNNIDNPAVQARAMEILGERGGVPKYTVTTSVVAPPDNSSGTSYADSVLVTAETTSPTVSAKIANAYADAVIAIRKEAEQGRYRAAEQVVKNQMELYATPAAKLSADYVNLAQQLGNLQIAEATAIGGFKVIVPATPPKSPSSPQPAKSAAIGFAVGLLAGIGLAFVVGRLDTRVRTHREAAEIIGLPVLGRVPRIQRQQLRTHGLVALTDPDGHLSEALRMLRSSLEWAGIDDHLHSLLITSCVKGEGKTLTTCNLAVTLARAGKKVIVVDADLRDPRVHTVFGLPNAVGLTSVVIGQTALKEALQIFRPSPATSSPVTGRPVSWPQNVHESSTAALGEGSLLVLTSGPLPPDPGEVAASRRLASALKEVASLNADYVLVDAPPILSVGDAGPLSSSVDGLLLVANLEKIRRATLLDGRELLDALPCRKVGVVVVGERVDHQDYYRYQKSPSARS